MSYHFVTPGYNLIRYFNNRELDELYVSTFLKTLARSLVLVFIPIYLANLGFSVRIIALFYLFEFLGMILATPLGLWMNHKIGVKKTMAVADVIFIFYMLAVANLKVLGPYLLVPTLFFAVGSGLFWAAYHVDFTKNADRRAEGQELSLIKAIIILASAFGPLIGSLVIVNLSFSSSFMAASILSIMAIVPLFFSRDFKAPRPQFSLARLRKVDDKVKARSYAAFGMMQLTNETFWPLFIFYSVRNIVEVGALFTVTTLILVVVILWFGRRVDSSPRRSLVAGVWLHAPSWLARIFLVSPLGIFLMNAYGQLSYQVLDTAFEKVVYSEAATSKDVANYFFFRQIYIGLGRFIICMLVFISGSLELAFIVTALVLFAHLGLRNRLRN